MSLSGSATSDQSHSTSRKSKVWHNSVSRIKDLPTCLYAHGSMSQDVSESQSSDVRWSCSPH